MTWSQDDNHGDAADDTAEVVAAVAAMLHIAYFT